MAHFQHALKLNPGLLQARFNLATALENMGRVDEAIAQYREVLRKAPGNRAAKTRLDALLQKNP